jgi:hypothetical protein
MLPLEEHSYHLQSIKLQLLWRKWRPTKVGTKKELKPAREVEVDMLSVKMDLLMKRLDERADEKKEVMHIHDSRMTCEECGDIGHSRSNCLELQEDVNYLNNNNNYYRPQQNQG